MCRRLNLFAHAVAAIDGSKFKVVNARDKNFTRAKLQKRMDQVEASIERYMAALASAILIVKLHIESHYLDGQVANLDHNLTGLHTYP
jgi:hypothetical protein